MNEKLTSLKELIAQRRAYKDGLQPLVQESMDTPKEPDYVAPETTVPMEEAVAAPDVDTVATEPLVCTEPTNEEAPVQDTPVATVATVPEDAASKKKRRKK